MHFKCPLKKRKYILTTSYAEILTAIKKWKFTVDNEQWEKAKRLGRAKNNWS